jgi:hypothetical protein
MYRLIADDNKILTNGTRYTSQVEIFAEELEAWTEVDVEEKAVEGQ